MKEQLINLDEEARKKHSNERAKERNRKYRARLKELRPTKKCIECDAPIISMRPKIRCLTCSKIHAKLVRDRNEFNTKPDRDIEIETLKKEIKGLKHTINYYKRQKNLTSEQKQRDKERNNIRNKKNADKVREYKKSIKYKEVRIKCLQEYFNKYYPNETDIIFERTAYRSMYGELTRLMFDDQLPKECEVCGSTYKLRIHHKQYCYPILLEHLQRLCMEHHDKSHHPESPSLSKLEKNKMRMRHSRLLKNIKHCQKCGADGTTDRGRLEVHHYKYDDNPESYIKVCRACHHRKTTHHNDARQQHTEEVLNIIKRNIIKEVQSVS